MAAAPGGRAYVAGPHRQPQEDDVSRQPVGGVSRPESAELGRSTLELRIAQGNGLVLILDAVALAGSGPPRFGTPRITVKRIIMDLEPDLRDRHPALAPYLSGGRPLRAANMGGDGSSRRRRIVESRSVCYRPLGAFGGAGGLILAGRSTVGRSRISRWQPTAAAYFRSVAIDGELRLLPPPASRRATAGVLVPIFSATSAWVSPALCRAPKSSSRSAKSAA